jgi:zinc transporter ZupT
MQGHAVLHRIIAGLASAVLLVMAQTEVAALIHAQVLALAVVLMIIIAVPIASVHTMQSIQIQAVDIVQVAVEHGPPAENQ